MLPDVPKGRGPQKRVHHRVDQHVRVRVAQKPLLIGDLHSSQDQPALLHQPVYVVSLSDSHNLSDSFPF